MMTFTDLHGRAWTPRITVATVRTVRTVTGVDLFKILTEDGQLQELFGDIVKVVDVLWLACRGQHAGVTDEDFASGLAGDICEKAIDALLGAILDFFPNPKIREAYKVLQEKQQQTKQLLSEAALAQAIAVDPERVAADLQREQMSKNSSSSSRVLPE